MGDRQSHAVCIKCAAADEESVRIFSEFEKAAVVVGGGPARSDALCGADFAIGGNGEVG